MAVDENKDYFPEPFPEGLPVVHLERISLAKLMDDDEKESERLFDICCNEGFCYVDLTSHPQGIKLTEEADSIHQVGKEIFATTSMMDKNTFKERPEDVGVFDTGYNHSNGFRVRELTPATQGTRQSVLMMKGILIGWN